MYIYAERRFLVCLHKLSVLSWTQAGMQLLGYDLKLHLFHCSTYSKTLLSHYPNHWTCDIKE